MRALLLTKLLMTCHQGSKSMVGLPIWQNSAKLLPKIEWELKAHHSRHKGLTYFDIKGNVMKLLSVECWGLKSLFGSNFVDVKVTFKILVSAALNLLI